MLLILCSSAICPTVDSTTIACVLILFFPDDTVDEDTSVRFLSTGNEAAPFFNAYALRLHLRDQMEDESN